MGIMHRWILIKQGCKSALWYQKGICEAKSNCGSSLLSERMPPPMDREALRRRLKSQMDQLVDELFAVENPPRTIDEIEQAALRLRDKAGQRVTKELPQAAAEAHEKEDTIKKISCSCGR